MPWTDTFIPPELVEIIIQHLSGDKDALQSCALVSQTWSVFSQRALFRNVQVHLYTYEKLARFLDDLVSVPHVQTLVRGLRIDKYCHDEPGISFHAHLSCSASVLARLPNLIKVAFQGGVGDDTETRSYLDLIPNILGNAPLVELDIEVESVETFHHVFDILEGTSVKRISLSGFHDPYKVDLGATRKLLHLPSLEHIRFGVDNLEEEFWKCLMHYFDLPRLKQCEIVAELIDGLIPWRHLLLREFPPLELFKFELGSDFAEDLELIGILEESAYQPLPLAGLPFQRVHLSVHPRTLNEARKFIEWWCSTFRDLSDSDATIHFTELTFAFTDLPGIETLEAAWNSLDDSLAHTTLGGVRSIHFESGGQKITQVADPVLADKLRLVLPQLASRGILRLV